MLSTLRLFDSKSGSIGPAVLFAIDVRLYSQPFAFAQFCSRLTFGIWISDLVNAEAMTKAEAPDTGGQFCCDFKGSLDIFSVFI